MTILDPDPDNEHGENDDSFGRINGWWFYIKSFLFNPYTIFHPKRKEKEYEPEW
jgi:hypothetical protein